MLRPFSDPLEVDANVCTNWTTPELLYFATNISVAVAGPTVTGVPEVVWKVTVPLYPPVMYTLPELSTVIPPVFTELPVAVVINSPQV